MSSNPQFHRVLCAQEYETFTFPKHILYDTNLTGNAVKLLLVMLDYGKRPNWQLRQSHLIAISGMGYTTFSTAMQALEKAGYVKRGRQKVKGKWLPYSYEFSAFPVFIDKSYEKPPHTPFEPDQVFQSGNSSLENPNFSLSNIDNVLEETTKPEHVKKNLVSSSFQKLKDLEQISDISDSQKATLYKKYSHEEILSGIQAIDIESADCVFAVLISAIKEKWKPRESAQVRNAESVSIFNQAEAYLITLGAPEISIGIDDKNAYIYRGTAVTKFPLNDVNFKEKFVKSINQYIKK